MNKNILTNAILIITLSLAASVYALPPGSMPDWTGSQDFSYDQNGWLLTGHVDYAVYHAENWTGNFTPDADYIYTYQIFNDSTSIGIVDSLSVLLPAGADLGSIDTEEIAGGVLPFFSYFTPDISNAKSTLYLFLPAFHGNPFGGFIDPGDYSAILYFTSNNQPTMGESILSNQGISLALPTALVPEPITLVLLAFGSLAIRAKRKRPNIPAA